MIDHAVFPGRNAAGGCRWIGEQTIVLYRAVRYGAGTEMENTIGLREEEP